MKINYPPDKTTRAERIKEITEKLEAGIRDLFNSENYKNWLRTMSRFHNYSVNNRNSYPAPVFLENTRNLKYNTDRQTRICEDDME